LWELNNGDSTSTRTLTNISPLLSAWTRLRKNEGVNVERMVEMDRWMVPKASVPNRRALVEAKRKAWAICGGVVYVVREGI